MKTTATGLLIFDDLLIRNFNCAEIITAEIHSTIAFWDNMFPITFSATAATKRRLAYRLSGRIHPPRRWRSRTVFSSAPKRCRPTGRKGPQPAFAAPDDHPALVRGGLGRRLNRLSSTRPSSMSDRDRTTSSPLRSLRCFWRGLSRKPPLRSSPQMS